MKTYEEKSKPKIEFHFIPANLEKLPIYVRDGKFIINPERPSAVMFYHAEKYKKVVRHELARAIIAAMPDNSGYTMEEFNREYYRQIDNGFTE